MTTRALLVISVLVGCSSKSGGGAKADNGNGNGNGSGSGGSGSAVVKKKTGFSAALSADLAGEAGSAAAAGTAAAAGSGTGTGSGTATGTGSGTATATAAGSGMGSGKEADPVADEPEVKKPRGPTKVPPELAAIKFDLEPNWDRDYDGPGTFGFVLKIPNSTQTRVFSFHYGYDDAKAPADCDEYKAWVTDAKSVNVTLERQRGAACYIEGTDASNEPVFLYHLVYGGKHLLCYGLLYKDPADNRLGNLRDEVLMQAKKICETITL